jgi:hypothetical protein
MRCIDESMSCDVGEVRGRPTSCMCLNKSQDTSHVYQYVQYWRVGMQNRRNCMFDYVIKELVVCLVSVYLHTQQILYT